MDARTLWLIVLILTTVAFRLAALDPFSLHEDEALYAAYATHIARTGDFLLDEWTGFPHDKHPLFFWLLAGIIRVLGNTETSIRILSLSAEIGSTVLIYLIGLRLSGTLAAVIAGTLFATSLLASLHGLSVFMDPLTIALGLTGILFATYGRYGLSGVFLGLSVSMKLLGALYVPIVGIYALAVGGIGGTLRLAGGFSGIVVILFGPAVYNSVFGEGSFLGRGMQNQRAGLELVKERWLSKMEFFINLLEWLFASRVARVIVYAGAFGSLSSLFVGPKGTRWFVISSLLSLFAYYIGLSIISSPVYDRYFLYAVPLFSLIAGIGIARLLDLYLSERWQAALAPLFFAVLTVFNTHGIRLNARADIPFSALTRSDVFGGFVPLCNWLKDHADGRRVWVRSLGWHLAYCLQGTPVEAVWFPDSGAILADGRPALLVLSPHDSDDVVAALRDAGWSVEHLRAFGGVAGDDLNVYEIKPAGAS